MYAARALYAGALAWPIADYATTNTHVLHPYATLLSGALVSSGSEAAFYVALTLLVAPALSI
ncbi:MAG TPA: hypothetical protein VHM19_21445, partial [Polyangiales bacterium]|nr:hypothetical protein [Polyangiales bacterium]